ncbi:MAG: diguanylate cyclase [Betaproteobacteria bacterium]|nr:diguanylate cyclase [Betaproteobacteria bacterium]
MKAWRGCIAAWLLALAGTASGEGALAPLPSAADPVLLGPFAEVFEDASRTMRLEQVRAAAEAGGFSRRDGAVLNFGYSYSAHWIRFRLPATPGPLLLEVDFPSLDELNLSVPFRDAGGRLGYREQWAGDTRPWDQREVKHRNHVFRVDAGRDAGEWIYLRVHSLSVVTVPLRLWAPEAFAQAERDSQLGYGLFYGFVLALLLYNLMLWITLRDPVSLWYVLYVGAFWTGLFIFGGFGFQYLWPGSVWWANHALGAAFCLTLGFGVGFSRRFLDTARISPVADRLFRGVGALSALGAVLAASGLLVSYGTIMRTLSVVGFATAALILYVAVSELLRGYRPARFFLLAWTALLVFIGLAALRNYAIVPTSFLTLNGLHIGLALDVLLLSFALADRIRSVERERKAAQAAVLESQHALLEATRASERELERRIAERTAEFNRVNEQLRTEAAERDELLALLKEQEQTLRFMAQHDPLTGLPNRHSMQQRLSLAIELAKRNRKKVAVMLVDLDRFKQLNDSRGHSAGDQALVTVAERLRTSVRGSDTVARYGGDEFVVIAADLDRAADASNIAEKIADMVGLPVPLEGGPWRGGCSIGISVYPDDSTEPVTLLALADKAMYGVKSNAAARYAYFAPV